MRKIALFIQNKSTANEIIIAILIGAAAGLMISEIKGCYGDKTILIAD